MTSILLIDGKTIADTCRGDAVLSISIGEVEEAVVPFQLLPNAPNRALARVVAGGAKDDVSLRLTFKAGSARLASTFQGDPRVSRSLAPAVVTTVVLDVKLPPGHPSVDGFREDVNGPNVRVCVAQSKRTPTLAQIVIVHTEPLVEATVEEE